MLQEEIRKKSSEIYNLYMIRNLDLSVLKLDHNGDMIRRRT